MIVLKKCARFTLFLYLCDLNKLCEQTFKVFQQVCNENHNKKNIFKKYIYIVFLLFFHMLEKNEYRKYLNHKCNITVVV